MLPDYGLTLTEQGCRADTRIIFIGLSPRTLTNYGAHREAHFVTYTNEYPLGVMLTVATLQSQGEILQLLGRRFFSAQGFVGPEVVGGGGERYRPLLGRVTALDDSVPDDVLREIHDRLVLQVLGTGPYAARLAQPPIAVPDRCQEGGNRPKAITAHPFRNDIGGD